MTRNQRILVVCTFVTAQSAFAGTVILALHGPRPLAGMGVCFALAVPCGLFLTAQRGGR